VKIQFLKYLFFGGIGAAVDLFMFFILVDRGVYYQIANVIGYLFGTIVSFLLNRRLTFNTTDRIFYRLSLFISVAFFGYLLSALILFILIDGFEVNSMFAKFLTLPIIAIFQFIVNKNITFLKR
jgi:putative flippase GtrA